MKSTIIFVVIFILQSRGEDKIKIKDSYLQAYYNSKTSLASSKNDRVDRISPFYDHSGPEKNYGPPQGYPESNYGPPQHGYSELNSYGPPVYGPPVYGPPAQGYPMSFPGIPHTLLGLLEKLHLKLDIFTVLKIILKLVIFKKLISFIAILCLLLFIPKFKPKMGMGDEGEDELRSFSNTKSRASRADEHINVLTNYVVNAFEKYSGNTNQTCDGIICESSRILRDVDNKYSYERLVTLYSQES